MTTPPTGTVTFLFTDIEGSTTRWEHHRAAMQAALDRHNDLLAAAIAQHGGFVFKTVGDAFCAAFADPARAVAAALDAQRALAAENWARFGSTFPYLRVRMALHTGPAEHRDGDYLGPPLNRTARLMSAAHGGQILLSLATQQLVRDHLPDGARLLDLGEHRLKDLKHTEHLFRLAAPGFPDIPAAPDTAEALPAGAHPPVDVDALPAECPYRGLFAFREADAPFFFGRERFTDRLVGAVGTARLVGVIGPSGSGKSSVVFAGLVPRLRDTDAHDAGPCIVLEMRPGARPFHALAAELVPLLEPEMTRTDRLIEINKMAEALQRGVLDVAGVMRAIRDAHGGPGRAILVADQFEELYTLCPGSDVRHRFLDALFDTLVAPGAGAPALTVVLTLRADFMGHALAYRPFSDALQDHQVNLGPMTKDELTAAIVQPAEKQGRAFESGLPERLLADLGDHPGNLPLLEFALTQLWEHQASGWLTHEAYDAIGHIEGALARYADGVYAGLSPADAAGAERVFLQLIRPGEGTEDTRRITTHAELGEPDWALVRRLADARLVVTDRDATGAETAEVVHEALIRSWGRLRGWMDANRAFRTWQERLRHALRQWEASDHDEGALLRGAPLAEAEGWLKERGAELSEGERAFVAAGIDLRDRREREREEQVQRELAAAQELAVSARKLRQRAVLLSIALAAAVVLAGIAVVLGNRSRLATARAESTSADAFARELAGASMANRERDPELSVLLALRAISVSETSGGVPVPEPERALHLALQHTRRRQTIVAHEGGVNDVAVSPDGLRIATCGKDGIKLWELATGTAVLTITEAITTVATVAFSPDGALLASGGPDGAVRLWDAATGEDVRRLDGHTDAVTQVAFSPDGVRVASASKDKTAVVWDVGTGAALVTLAGHTGAVNSVAWSPDGARVATGSADYSARLWDVSSGAQLLVISHFGSRWSVYSVAFSPDGARLATISGDARIWDTTTGGLIQVLLGHVDQLSEAVFNSNGSTLLTASLDKTSGMWDVTGLEAGVAPLMFRLAGHSGPVGDVAFSPDGASAITASSDGTIGVWNVTRALAWRTLHGPDQYYRRVRYSPDGRTIITEGDGIARIWDLAANTPTITLTGHISEVVQVAFSPVGRTVATGSRDSTAKLWDPGTGKLIRTLEGHSNTVWGLAFSPDGVILATSSVDATSKLWDLRSGALLRTLTGHDLVVSDVAFSPDGNRLVTGSNDKMAKVWEVATGKELLTLIGHTGDVGKVRFSPDGKQIATASSQDRTARMWDAVSGREIFSITSHQRPIQGLAFSPDGASLVTSSWDGAVKVWNAATGEELVAVAESAGRLLELAFSPDGSQVAVGSGPPYGNIYIYTLRQPELIALARERVTRSLTAEECRVYLHAETCPEDR